MGNITGLNHIGLFVKDIEQTMNFYESTLGMKCVHKNQVEDENGDIIHIWFGQLGNLVIEFVQFPLYEKRKDGWFDHIAFDVDDIEAVKIELEKRGVQFDSEEITTWDHFFERGDKWIMFRGPDGERLEINQKL